MRLLLFLPAILILGLWWLKPHNKKEVEFTLFNHQVFLTVAIGSFTITKSDGYESFSRPTFTNDYFLDPVEHPDLYRVPIFVNLIGSIYPQIYGDAEDINLVTPLWIISAGSVLIPVIWLRRRNLAN